MCVGNALIYNFRTKNMKCNKYLQFELYFFVVILVLLLSNITIASLFPSSSSSVDNDINGTAIIFTATLPVKYKYMLPKQCLQPTLIYKPIDSINGIVYTPYLVVDTAGEYIVSCYHVL